MTFLKTTIVTLLLFISSLTFAQVGKNPFIDSVTTKVKALLPKNWFVVQNTTGFSVYYCRSCAEYETVKLKEENATASSEKIALNYFTTHGADSVSFYSMLSPDYIYKADPSAPLSDSEKKEARGKYKPADILKLDVVFTTKWENAHYDSIKNNNELLREKVLAQLPAKRSPKEFDDFRYWVPGKEWNSITQQSFSFERLPYQSSWYNYSVFIIPHLPFYDCSILYCDKKDPDYYTNPDNDMNREYSMIQGIIAYALGIKDYRMH